MCVPGCHDVLRRRFGRRGFLGCGAGALATLAVGSAKGAGPTPQKPTWPPKIVDLTHQLTPDFPTFFGTSGLTIHAQAVFSKDSYNLNTWSVFEHVGTHMDAPIHFSADGMSLGEIDAEDLLLPLVIIDISAKASENSDAALDVDDIAAFESTHGLIPSGACVAMYSGWAHRLGSGTFRNADKRRAPLSGF